MSFYGSLKKLTLQAPAFESYLYNVLIYAVYGLVLVCYYANEIKFKPSNRHPVLYVNV